MKRIDFRPRELVLLAFGGFLATCAPAAAAPEEHRPRVCNKSPRVSFPRSISSPLPPGPGGCSSLKAGTIHVLHKAGKRSHSGGRLRFGPGGLLYIGTGDGGGLSGLKAMDSDVAFMSCVG